MADWSDVEFASKPHRRRRLRDIMLILADLLICIDLLGCIAAGEAALALYPGLVAGRRLNMSLSGPLWHDILFGSVIAALVLRERLSLISQSARSVREVALITQQRCLVAFGVLTVIGLSTRVTDDLARLWLFSWLALFTLCAIGTRLILRAYIRSLHGRAGLGEAVAIIGGSETRERLAERIAGDARIVGLFGAPAPSGMPPSPDAAGDGAAAPAAPMADDLARLMAMGRDGIVDSVILALGPGQTQDGEMAHLVERLKALPVQVAICPDQSWSAGTTPQVRMLGGLPMRIVADRPLQLWDMILKTMLDKLGALLLLVLLAPLMLAIGLAVGLTSKGPVIFRQRRKGWFGRDFTVFKFRTMRTDAADAFPAYQTRRGDVRCTRVGRLLRRCSLDELPQLWNVVRGDMSLVGPRPHAESLHDIDRAGREIVAEYAQRHRVKPGITGWAQIHGARGATATLDQLRRRVEYDLYYIDHWSIWLDLQILARTFLCLIGDNAF